MVSALSLRPNVISPVNEKLYHTSNLMGEWQGKFPNGQSVTFKVFNIVNGNAQVEYDHNGQIDRGTAAVNKNIITYGPVQIATKDGSAGVLLFKSGSYSISTALVKSAKVATAT